MDNCNTLLISSFENAIGQALLLHLAPDRVEEFRSIEYDVRRLIEAGALPLTLTLAARLSKTSCFLYIYHPHGIYSKVKAEDIRGPYRNYHELSLQRLDTDRLAVDQFIRLVMEVILERDMLVELTKQRGEAEKKDAAAQDCYSNHLMMRQFSEDPEEECTDDKPLDILDRV